MTQEQLNQLVTELAVTEDESLFEYKLRICSVKDKYDLTWKELSFIINTNFGTDLSGDAIRKFSYRHLGLGNNTIQDDLDVIQLKKERIKLSEERQQLNAFVRTISREETLKEIALSIAEKIKEKRLLEYKPSNSEVQTRKSAIVLLSDWHYGLEVTLGNNKYNPEIMVDRLNTLLSETLFVIEKEQVEEVVIVNLGDLISGNIHLPLRIQNRVDIITQTIEVEMLLADFISTIANKVPKLKYCSVTDNHSRFNANKKESLQAESFVRIIDWVLEKDLKDFTNIEFLPNNLSEDITVFNVQGHTVVGVHGDKDGTNAIEKLTSYLNTKIDLLVSAHLHHFESKEHNHTMQVINGSLIGTDEHANKLRLNAKPSQSIIICTPKRVDNCIYRITLGE